ncbi:MAG: hypothetical protein WBB23_11045 [Desulforhopalus sp.]
MRKKQKLVKSLNGIFRFFSHREPAFTVVMDFIPLKGIILQRAPKYSTGLGGLVWERKKRKRNVVENIKRRRESAVLTAQKLRELGWFEIWWIISNS